MCTTRHHCRHHTATYDNSVVYAGGCLLVGDATAGPPGTFADLPSTWAGCWCRGDGFRPAWPNSNAPTVVLWAGLPGNRRRPRRTRADAGLDGPPDLASTLRSISRVCARCEADVSSAFACARALRTAWSAAASAWRIASPMALVRSRWPPPACVVCTSGVGVGLHTGTTSQHCEQTAQAPPHPACEHARQHEPNHFVRAEHNSANPSCA